MRFYKSKKIGKGAKISFSKSGGVRLGVGIPGFNVSMGKKGMYLNMGIPGTGLSQRTKIGVSKKRKKPVKKTVTVRQTINLHMDDNGNIIFKNAYGRLITDQKMINKIKRSPSYSAEVQRMRKEMASHNASQVEAINAENQDLINICKYAMPIQGVEYFIEQRDNLEVASYEDVEPYPTQSSIRAALEEEAEEEITGWKIWEIPKLRHEYVESNLRSRLVEEIEIWEEECAEFEKNAEEEYRLSIKTINELINGNEEYVSSCLDAVLEDISLPLDFDVSYDLRNNDRTIYVDLDLPEIDDLPNEKATQLADGQIKMKAKTKGELYSDYCECVFGFAVLFTTLFFSVSPYYETVIMSGYTQRRNKVGDINDEYVFSIKYEREKMKSVKNYETIDPIGLSMNFENRCNMLKSGNLKAITPFE